MRASKVVEDCTEDVMTPSLIMDDVEEARCLLHACEVYLHQRLTAGKPASRIEEITKHVRQIVSMLEAEATS